MIPPENIRKPKETSGIKWVKINNHKLSYPNITFRQSKKAVSDKAKSKLFEETLKQVSCTNVRFDNNLLKEKEKLRQDIKFGKDLQDHRSQSFDPISKKV